MRIDVRDPETRRRLGKVEIDLREHPTRARIGESDREIFLEWEAAIDDSGRLRRCLVCGCRDMYSARVFPQVTGFVVVLAFAGAGLGILGIANRYPVLYAVLVVVLILDIASLVFSRKRLVCYRCRSTYSDVEIARHHGGWDRALAERYSDRSTAETAPPAPRVSDRSIQPEPEVDVFE